MPPKNSWILVGCINKFMSRRATVDASQGTWELGIQYDVVSECLILVVTGWNKLIIAQLFYKVGND